MMSVLLPDAATGVGARLAVTVISLRRVVSGACAARTVGIRRRARLLRARSALAMTAS
jgi:hypothetical protein